MKTRIHVNGHTIRDNKKNGEDNPVITVKDYKRNRYTKHATVCCPHCEAEVVEVKQDFDQPLKSGAVAWIETEGPVEVE